MQIERRKADRRQISRLLAGMPLRRRGERRCTVIPGYDVMTVGVARNLRERFTSYRGVPISDVPRLDNGAHLDELLDAYAFAHADFVRYGTNLHAVNAARAAIVAFVTEAIERKE